MTKHWKIHCGNKKLKKMKKAVLRIHGPRHFGVDPDPDPQIHAYD
jgi:hypothetical protein